ncbi:MAG: hypothetical protein JW829_21345 [Pirellulales bacterium]|nr:hypothetical protein [Pirellulales bacterium]
MLTGAEWIETRFGRGRGANLAHLSVILFAIINVIGFIAYAFQGIGKFAVVFMPWDLTIPLHQWFYYLPAGVLNLLPETLPQENAYALIIFAITTLYVVKGGMFSVVLTEVLQFSIMTMASIIVGIIAMNQVSPDTIHAIVPSGWDNVFFGWKLDLDWAKPLDLLQKNIQEDDFSFFTIILMLMLFKGILASMGGPAPNYDMQRVLATRSSREASMMSGMVNVVLYFPRYMLVAGLTILALGPLMPYLLPGTSPGTIQEMAAAGDRGVGPSHDSPASESAGSKKAPTEQSIKKSEIDFEKLLPMVIRHILPVGLTGLLLAGLLAAFMSTFAATINAGPAYIVNDVYRRFINPQASDKIQVRMSYITSLVIVAIGIIFGFMTKTITEITMWIVGALYGGYVAANVLKWHWWRFNGYGYFWGMISGTIGAIVVPKVWDHYFPGSNTLYAFPAIFVLSILGCFAGTFTSKPESADILKEFYRTVRPWGFWKPIRNMVIQDDPAFQPNRRLVLDIWNVCVGILWQLALTALPIYIVIHQWGWVAGTFGLLVLTTLILKFSWYDRLEPEVND